MVNRWFVQLSPLVSSLGFLEVAAALTSEHDERCDCLFVSFAIHGRHFFSLSSSNTKFTYPALLRCSKVGQMRQLQPELAAWSFSETYRGR